MRERFALIPFSALLAAHALSRLAAKARN